MLELWLIVPANATVAGAAASTTTTTSTTTTSTTTTPCSTILLKKLARSQQVKKSPPFRNTKFHYRIYKSPPPVPIRRQINPVHDTASHFMNINFNIILLYTTPEFSGFLKEEQML
jgi:hypothetical protein